MNRHTQQQRILSALQDNRGGMTGMDFIHSLGIIDYRKRISELRRQGYNIPDEYEKSATGARYKRYYYREDEEE